MSDAPRSPRGESRAHPNRAAAVLIVGLLAAFANIAELGSVPMMTLDGPLSWGWAGPHRMDYSVAISLSISTAAAVAAVRLPNMRWALAAVSALHLGAAVYVRWIAETFLLD
ncbi:MAG: hypothetical protein ABL982_24100 [Vicinamibacterales bacterium]